MLIACPDRRASELSDELHGIRDAMLEYSTGRLILLTLNEFDQS